MNVPSHVEMECDSPIEYCKIDEDARSVGRISLRNHRKDRDTANMHCVRACEHVDKGDDVEFDFASPSSIVELLLLILPRGTEMR